MSWGGVRSTFGAAEGSSTTLIAHPRFAPLRITAHYWYRSPPTFFDLLFEYRKVYDG